MMVAMEMGDVGGDKYPLSYPADGDPVTGLPHTVGTGLLGDGGLNGIYDIQYVQCTVHMWTSNRTQTLKVRE